VRSHLFISAEPEDKRAYAVEKAAQEARDKQSDAERKGVQPALPGLSMADENQAQKVMRACARCGRGFFGLAALCRDCYAATSPAYQGRKGR